MSEFYCGLKGDGTLKTLHRAFALLSLAFLLAPFGSPRAESPVNPDARRLVELLRYREQFEVAKRSCLKTDRAISAESLQKEVPDYFGDFTPGDRRWPMVLEAYGDYVKAICEHPSVEENLALMSESYASLLSKEDLRASIDFYSSTAGQSLVTAHREITTALFNTNQEAQAKSAPRASALFRQRLEEISRGIGPDGRPGDNGMWAWFRGVVTHSYGFYYVSEFLFIVGFLVLGWRGRSAGLIVAAIAFVVLLLAQVELSGLGESLDVARKRGADLLPYNSARETWKLASAVGFLTGALGVMTAAFHAWRSRKAD